MQRAPSLRSHVQQTGPSANRLHPPSRAPPTVSNRTGRALQKLGAAAAGLTSDEPLPISEGPHAPRMDPIAPRRHGAANAPWRNHRPGRCDHSPVRSETRAMLASGPILRQQAVREQNSRDECNDDLRSREEEGRPKIVGFDRRAEGRNFIGNEVRHGSYAVLVHINETCGAGPRSRLPPTPPCSLLGVFSDTQYSRQGDSRIGCTSSRTPCRCLRIPCCFEGRHARREYRFETNRRTGYSPRRVGGLTPGTARSTPRECPESSSHRLETSPQRARRPVATVSVSPGEKQGDG